MISKQTKDRRRRPESVPKSQQEIEEDFDETDVDHEANLHAPQIDDYQTMVPLSGQNVAAEDGRRADDTILDNVTYMLSRHSEIDADDIGVQVDKGEVILRGSVPEERMKFMAAEVIKLIPGVKSVTNQLKYTKVQ